MAQQILPLVLQWRHALGVARRYVEHAHRRLANDPHAASSPALAQAKSDLKLVDTILTPRPEDLVNNLMESLYGKGRWKTVHQASENGVHWIDGDGVYKGEGPQRFVREIMVRVK